MVEVLVVDDDPSIREMVRICLDRAHFDVYEAADGRMARKMLRTSPDAMVVVLDADLPRASAQSILEAARTDAALARHAYVYLTSQDSEHFSPALALLADGQVGVLRTPLAADEVVEIVTQASERLARVKRVSLQPLG